MIFEVKRHSIKREERIRFQNAKLLSTASMTSSGVPPNSGPQNITAQEAIKMADRYVEKMIHGDSQFPSLAEKLRLGKKGKKLEKYSTCFREFFEELYTANDLVWLTKGDPYHLLHVLAKLSVKFAESPTIVASNELQVIFFKLYLHLDFDFLNIYFSFFRWHFIVLTFRVDVIGNSF